MSAEESTPKPPRTAAWLLKKLFSDREMFSTLGDLEEIFGAEAASRGQKKARRWYWAQLLKALPYRALAVVVLDVPMFFISLKIMFRSLRKHKLFSALSMLALALGLTCFFLVFLYVRYESTYDSFHLDSGRLFRLMLEDTPGEGRERAAGPAAHALEENIPEIEATVPTCLGFKPIVKIGTDNLETDGLFAGQDFLRLFRFPLRRGSATTLSEPGNVVLTEGAARRFFGDEDPIGRSLDFSIRGEKCRLTVSGLMDDPPPNTHFRFELLISFPTTQTLPGYKNLLESWKNRFPRTYVKVRRHVPVEVAAEKVTAFLKRPASGPAAGPSLRATLQPLSDIHLRPDGKDDAAVRTLRLFLFLSVLILAVAVMNYINLATSRSSLRRQEVGIRKTIGASRGQLIRQFLGEAVALTSMSFIPAVASLLALLPSLNRTMEREIRLGQLLQGASGLEIAGILVLVGVAAGIYPALHLSSSAPARILKGSASSTTGPSRPRNVLLVVQLAAAVVLVVLTLFIQGQVRFIRGRDPGFENSGLVEAWAFAPNGIEAKRSLLQNPKVAGVTLVSNVMSLSDRAPLDERWGKIEIRRGSGWEPMGGGVFHLRCDSDFISVFNLRLLAGRDFSASRDETSSAIVNETLARRLGPGDPIGKIIKVNSRDHVVIGVVKDFHFQPLYASIGPALLTSSAGEDYALLYVKFGPAAFGDALPTVKRTLDEFFPEESHSPVFLEDRLAGLYRGEYKQAALMSFFSTLAVVIAALSVFGLAGFAVERRTREIVIRKVLGVRTGQLASLLFGDFTILLAVAFALGSPLAYVFVNRWLANFAYHVPVRAGTFVMAAAGMLAMTILASGTQILRAFRIDPVETLKSE